MTRPGPSLFDAPGPLGRRRIRIATAAATVLGLALLGLALRQFAVNGQLDRDKWAPYGTMVMWRYLLTGLLNTVFAAAVTLLLSCLFGILLALACLSKHAAVRVPARCFLEVFRVLPPVLLILFALFVLPRYGLDLPLLWKLVVPLTANRSAQLAVVFRAGIAGLDPGQREAAAALGMRQAGTMVHVVLPQALRNVLPSLVSQTVGIVKDTSLGLFVSYLELLKSAQVLAAFNHLLIQSYLVVALVYLLVNYSLSRLARWLDARRSPGISGNREKKYQSR
ncbi:amino acid ABC transporter permease [Amycolatopsis sp. H20-H5]|uniref:amino acid ABC transporter permease n=1 Tax=Amycolatopsis sp. H20-H5 TaxID=3046309 RepID=UPI002DB92443|nr:amino acid ABC transporter permease [Amycolatopsis sp. H20-H5]MEC3979018.1 amino acid ABC transporter permease [Amycolatopsis sp. H20-H5]